MTKIKKILTYVSQYNEFYRRLIQEYGISDPLNLGQYPILTRQQLQKNRYNMFSKEYKSKYFAQQLHRQSSSGSSGVPVNVYWDPKDLYVSNLALWRKRFQWYGIFPDDRCVTFMLNSSAENRGVCCLNDPDNILDINISYIYDEKRYLKVVEYIADFKPTWFSIQPFILRKLLNIYKENAISIPQSLKYIESVGELLAPDLKKLATEFFCVPIVNMYGSEEMNGIAYECPQHHMHVLDNNVLIEVCREGKIYDCGEGEAIITNLNNFAMPLIRYSQGDQIVLNNLINKCKCGLDGMVVDLIAGRTHSVIKTESGLEITSFMLMGILSEINNVYNYIIDNYFFIYEKSRKHLCCFLSLNSEAVQWYDSVSKSVIKQFSAKYPKCKDIVLTVSALKGNMVPQKKFNILEIRK